jgi:hypothetical protein
MYKSYLLSGVLAVALLAGCQEDPMSSGNMAANDQAALRTESTTTLTTAESDAVATALVDYLTGSEAAKVGRGSIWADDYLYGTIGTPALFDGVHGKFDKLYQNVVDMEGHFKDGVGAISESKPGDQDYNGGRWDVYVLKEGVDPDKYSNASSVEDLDLNDFMPAGVWLECPLLPARGGGNH